MPRRVRMPAAEELFRTKPSLLRAVPDPVDDDEDGEPAAPARRPAAAQAAAQSSARTPVRTAARTARSAPVRGASGRERHDEKITVYVSPEELVALEQARIALRAEHGLAVDRGRIVREAIDLLLADFTSQGESSLLVQSLRGQ
ncbi:MAG TPA: cobyrinic acid a,c-diamide synthase [Actinocrinis sp.]|nr:cobyrinic acid a,c-diamide synthase [Actinocrinis sp.]